MFTINEMRHHQHYRTMGQSQEKQVTERLCNAFAQQHRQADLWPRNVTLKKKKSRTSQRDRMKTRREEKKKETEREKRLKVVHIWP